MHCDVVMVGYRLNAKEPAAKALERILGLPPEVARRLARAFPVTVVEGASDTDAARIRTELEAAGALVELRSLSSAGLAPVRPANEQAEPAPRAAQRLTPDPARLAHAGTHPERAPAASARQTPEPMRSMHAPTGAELSSSTAARLTPEPARPANPEHSGELVAEPRPGPG
ncbi:MAG TPA: hypothetical protein VG963_09890, partial [Polyangiaceae bacterium]|nr:hypothetical protein [Polyangiaceae bacterium]